MGDVGHKAFSHDSNGLAFQGVQARRLLNHFHGTASDGRHHGVIATRLLVRHVRARLYLTGFITNNAGLAVCPCNQ